MHAEACMQMHGTSKHCGSQVAADCHLMHSTGHNNFAGRRSLEKLYDANNRFIYLNMAYWEKNCLLSLNSSRSEVIHPERFLTVLNKKLIPGVVGSSSRNLRSDI